MHISAVTRRVHPCRSPLAPLVVLPSPAPAPPLVPVAVAIAPLPQQHDADDRYLHMHIESIHVSDRDRDRDRDMDMDGDMHLDVDSDRDRNMDENSDIKTDMDREQKHVQSQAARQQDSEEEKSDQPDGRGDVRAAPINMNASGKPWVDHDTNAMLLLLAIHRKLNTPLAQARQPVWDAYWLMSRVNYIPSKPRPVGVTPHAVLGAWASRALMLWQMVFNVSDSALSFMIKLINCIIRCLGHGTAGAMPNTKGKSDTDWFPSSLHTLQARLNTVHIGTQKDGLITRFVLCPNKQCGARYHMAQARQLMVCQAEVWVRPAPKARSWVRQWCHTRLFRSVDGPVGSAPIQRAAKKAPHMHKYEKDALNHREPQNEQNQQQQEEEQEQEQKEELELELEQKHEQKQEQQPEQEQEPQPHGDREQLQAREEKEEHKQEQQREMGRPRPRHKQAKRKKPPADALSEAGRRVSARLLQQATSASSARRGTRAGAMPVCMAVPSVHAAAASASAPFGPAPPPPPVSRPPLSAAAAAAYATDYVPECMYPYCGIIAPLKIMLMRPGFEDACTRHRWRGRPGGAHGNTRANEAA
jgi:hypothetical protein